MVPTDLPVDEIVAFVLSHLSRSQMRILDVGCGNGLVASRLQAHGQTVVAIDESPEIVQAANASGVAARIAAWPSFEDDPFDIILFAASLHHIHPLTEAVEQAHRLLLPSGLIIVEDFAWDDIDMITAEWFYGVVRLLASCKVVSVEGDSFVAELAKSGGEFTCWQHSHDHELHTITAMWSTLQTRFHKLSETKVPYLYRYLCPVLPENDIGYRVASQVLELEGRLANLDTIPLIGRRFVGRKI